MDDVTGLKLADQTDGALTRAVEAIFRPMIDEEIRRLRALGDDAKDTAIAAAVARLQKPATGWQAMSAQERSEELSRRWIVRKANSARKAAPIRRKRKADDFYPSPPEVTHALLAVEGQRLNSFSVVSEPACGDGAMSKVLAEAGIEVVSSDLIDRGFGQPSVDFLCTSSSPSAIVTNPPFNLAREFIKHALGELGVEYLALFLQAGFFQSKVGAELFRAHPPSVIYPLTFRPKFRSDGNFINFSWIVWDRQRPGPTITQPIGRAAQ